MPQLQAWLLAVRPKTLGMAVIPVVVGSALAFAQTHVLHVLPALAALLAAMLIQIGTNLHNDAADHANGVDTANRLGPLRVTAAGLLTAAQVMQGVKLCFLLAFCLGVYLVAVGGWVILVAGLLSLAAGAAYSGGKYPISHSPFGEVFVLVFFGVVAVAGSYYLQTLRVDASALLAGCVMGLPAAAVLVVNNTRDRESDRLAGRRTLAVLLGEGFSRAEYAGLLLLPFLIVAASGLGKYLPLLALPWVVFLLRAFCRVQQPGEFNPLLPLTAQFQLVLGLLLAIGEVCCQ
ncbi:MAG: 1,4-dihydroxy-2-naphthoate polyprenyltransferase [Gammaproteobacteria bacterium]|nr:1,4-dihydroxy-2-naphthoate polyprenyltransferase [Gammaproteobacteria bacterium]MBU1723966.1 1,4-dihydroxy-2-naphthoate polyprenyltransferase [Gammaproteobacteria bacterium]MBU2007159.1 1,4-dihydroxy-2-naphthoate polyprenyltransferase [Gammaproteobacteria bacterium]